jgi:hypothetical protein
MLIDLPSLVSFFGAVVIAFMLSTRFAAKAELLQQEIAKHGVHAQGRVVRVWQPPLLASLARVYFEYEPHGVGRTIQCCHIDRRPPDGCRASLPSIGSDVSVRYLPENPTRAVIAKLVSRFTH